MEFSDLLEARRSVRDYDLAIPVSDGELRALFRDVVLSPSAFNLQHWSFVVARSAQQRQRLRAAAMDQKQVEHCGAAIVVCGKLDAYADAPTLFAQAPPAMREQMVGMTAQLYGGNAQFARDEAIRSASLAAMTLMLAARARGFDTGPMIGYDPVKVAQAVNLPENYIPVMLVVLGRATGPVATPRGYRRPLSEVVRLESLDGPGLD